jgi:hypothetical protein
MAVGAGESLRYLDRTLRLATGWCDELIVYGDRPDPDTWDAVQRYATCARRSERDRYHESEIRNGLLGLCDDILDEDDLVVVLDADEELRTLEGDNPTSVLERLVNSDGPPMWTVQFWHLWTPDGTSHRVDGMWQPSIGWRIYRHRKGARLPDRECGVPPIPNMPHMVVPPVLGIAHWGYARTDDVTVKHRFYMERDGGRFHSLAHLESIIQPPRLEPVPWA